jgi:hypothetical protein
LAHHKLDNNARAEHEQRNSWPPRMVIRLTKRRDGNTVLRCDRADGTSTWQRQDGKLASVFPFHDMTHYAVETEMGFRSGFFGLIADGWEIGETTGKTPRGSIPDEARAVETIVGLFDVQRALGVEWTADEVNEHARTYVSARGGNGPEVRQLEEDEIVRVRARVRDLVQRWNDLAPDGTLELPFDSGTE